MRRLNAARLNPMTPLRRLRSARRDERGAVGVLIAMLISLGVLLGMGAMVIDVGQIYQNRADLQSGADAAALAIARICADGPCESTVGSRYVALNASKLTGYNNTQTSVCGNDVGMTSCPTPTGDEWDCPSAPSGSAYVDVYTATKTSAGSSLLAPALAKTLLGYSAYQGTTVKACAQAFYGPPYGANVTALTINAPCVWDSATGGGTDYAPEPPTTPDYYYDTVIPLGNTYCGAQWLNNPGSSCSEYVGSATYYGTTSQSATSACVTALYHSWSTHTALFVPGYYSWSKNGSNSSFSLRGFAAFVVTGYNIPGYFESDWLDSSNDYGVNGDYINGYFTTGVIPSTGQFQYPHDINGGDDMGGELVQLNGSGAEVTPYYGIDNP